MEGYSTNLLISARPQRQTNVEGCRIFGDLDQLKSKDTMQKTVIVAMTIYCTCVNFTVVLFPFLSSPWGTVYRFLHTIPQMCPL